MFTEKDSDRLTDETIKEALSRMGNADKVFSRIKEQLDMLACLPKVLSEELSVSLVGGSLRDILLDRPIKDLDLLVSGPVNIKINEFHKSLFDDIPISSKECFLMTVENKLKDACCLGADNSLSEDDLIRIVLQTDEYAQPSWKSKFNNIDAFVSEISVDMFYFLLKNNVENVLKEQGVNFKSDFQFETTLEEKTLEVMYLDTQSAFNIKNNDGYNKHLKRKEEFLLEYSVIKGVKSIIKISKDDDLNVDLIFSFMNPDNFVKTFDINLLKMFSVVSDKHKDVPDMESVMKSVRFNEDAILGYKNKTLEFSFFENELVEYGEKRSKRYEARIKKNREIFKDFKFKAVMGQALIYQNDNDTIKTSSIDDLKSNNVNIEMFELASNIVWKTLLNDEKSVKHSDVKYVRKIGK